MQSKIGEIYEGKVTGVTNFGAFVKLSNGESGMVHISEVSSVYVKDIHDFISEGQDVKVQILEVDQAGRLNLSIKRAQPRPQTQNRAPVRQAPKPVQRREPAVPMGEMLPPSADRAFEDKLKAFMSESDSKMAGVRRYEHKTKSRRR